ncbi:MAG TPA: CpaF family protein [Anaerolineales bacterium]|nr:CpaF family protein [Anaerolineales bacterium]HLO33565.1 CpaF family protein [Anaerolineales bacterium]
MAKKTATPKVPGITDPELLRPRVLRYLVELMDQTPPLGEHYEELLKDLIFQAYQMANGELGENENTFLDEILDYAADYGPMQEFFDEPQISEIMVNGPDQIFIEQHGKLLLTDTKYDNELQLRLAINHIINPFGRYVNYKHPMVDAHLKDGSRVNVIIPPVAQQGSCLSIRRFLKDKLSTQDLIEKNSMTQGMADFLAVCVAARLNIIVAGNTSSGKTTFLNILARSIPDDERIVTIEDSVELQMMQTHKVSLEARPPDYNGEGQVTIRDLVKNSLRMRPDRIIVGEIRGGEALDMLQAMNTGHDGSMTTVHSNSPRDTLSRLETMTLMAGFELPVTAIRKQIASALDLIVYLNRFPDGTRKVTQISEVAGMESDVITLTDIFHFQQAGTDSEGRPLGQFRPTGLRPMFSPKLEAMGYRLDRQMFMVR